MLGAVGQKILKGLHVVFMALTSGGIISILVLIVLKQRFESVEKLFFFDLSIYQIFNFVVNYTFYGILLTGLFYSLFTGWGFFKHRWIIVKWIVVLFLFAMTWIFSGPAINGMVALSDGGFKLPGSREEYFNYASRSWLSMLIMGFIFVFLIFISVLKPWGMRKPKFAVNRKILVSIVGVVVLIFIFFSVFNSLTLQRYRRMKIADVDISSLADGIYKGQAKIGGFTYKVEVKVFAHKITDLRIIQNRNSAYARFAEGVIPRIMEAQNPNVDTITGATTTSKCLMKAVENALVDFNRVK